jgi:hypothetical protein
MGNIDEPPAISSSYEPGEDAIARLSRSTIMIQIVRHAPGNVHNTDVWCQWSNRYAAGLPNAMLEHPIMTDLMEFSDSLSTS